MKIVRLMGGLGNQMLQYAFGKSISIITNEEVLFDKINFEERKKEEIGNTGFDKYGVSIRNYELDIFNLDIQFATEKQIKQCINQKVVGWKIPGLIRKIINKPKYITNNIIKEIPVNVFNPDFLEVKGDAYYEGYFHCDKYFNNIEDIIRKAFEFPPVTTQYNIDLLEKITGSENAASIHVRRGDYLNLPNFKKDMCCMSYFKKSAAYIASKVSNPTFFVFCAEDPEWIQNNFDIEFPFELIGVENIGPNAYYENMRLMSLCKHNIIVNSSYSWWGAWLNRNPDKIVIAPEPWFGDISDPIRDSWIRIQKS